MVLAVFDLKESWQITGGVVLDRSHLVQNILVVNCL